MMVPIQVIRWYRMQCYDGTDSCATVVPIRRYCQLKRIYTKKYDPQKYKKYDQFDAINIDKISEIPIDYTGKMGVPITILDKFDYGQFQLLGIDRTIQGNNTKTRFSVNGKRKYVRVIIINKKTNGEKIQTCNK